MLLAMWPKRKSGIPVAHLVIVNTKDDRSFVGYLTGSFVDSVVLDHARILPGREKVIGSVVIPAANVSNIIEGPPDNLIAD